MVTIEDQAADVGVWFGIGGSGLVMLTIGSLSLLAPDNSLAPGMLAGGTGLIILPAAVALRWTVRWWRAKRAQSVESGRPELRLIDGGRR